ncbi:MAG: hypothetical protein NZ700_03800 [Gemmataceae bacterium]|nr:hypothetical protein [Gemmataceae bacterium]MDW8265135.1 hypothetical protein [Gemmataceae bacterium]
MIVPRLNAPLVLVPGLLGFGELRLGRQTLASYFPGIVPLLRAAGNRTLVHWPNPTAGVAQRARRLGRFIRRHLGDQPIHLLAHSLGGLDARYLISRLGFARQVLTLTTIGTPHRGTTFADWGVRCLAPMLQPVFRCCGVPDQAFYDLTTTACRRFNAEVPDAPGVRYFSVAGWWHGPWRSPTWKFPHRLVDQAEGPNDGVVSVSSATYGEHCLLWPADHLGLVNWPNLPARLRGLPQDGRPLYATLLRRLADAGF